MSSATTSIMPTAFIDRSSLSDRSVDFCLSKSHSTISTIEANIVASVTGRWGT